MVYSIGQQKNNKIIFYKTKIMVNTFISENKSTE